MKRCLLLMLTGCLLCGCASLPSELQTQKGTLVLTSYRDWQAQVTPHPSTPNKAVTEWVRLGGVVAKVTNLPSTTRIEMVNLPITSAGKPILEHEPTGRFVAYVKGFVDPLSIEGRLITLLGTSAGMESGLIGQHHYLFPVMQVRQYHLWRVREQIVNVFPELHLRCRHGILCHDSEQYDGGQIIQVVE